jgi:predicted amidohydrolase
LVNQKQLIFLMKIALAQIHPFRGEIEKNIQKHQEFAKLAVQLGAEAVFFPELSLTSYEPELAKGLIYNGIDDRIDIFQELSNSHNIIIGAGMPTLSEKGIMISMLIFQPENQKLIYSKQKLHADELPFFVKGNQDIFIKAKNITIAPAICYESLITEHAEKAYQNAANVYLASVAKSAKGIEKAYHHYPIIAKKIQYDNHDGELYWILR